MASAIDNLPSGNSLYKTALERTSFPNGIFYDDQLSRVGSHAFQGYQSSYLSQIFLNAATLVADQAFADCIGLTLVSLPSCQTIGQAAFNGCANITELSLPVCTTIGSIAFENTLQGIMKTGSRILSLPACTDIYPGAFYNADMLTLDARALIRIFSGTSLTSNDKTRAGAFQGCSPLQTVYLSEIRSIGAGAFASCHNLISLYILGSRVPTVGSSNAFSSTPIGGYSTSAGRFGSVFVLPSMYSAFISADFWSTISSRIVSYVEG
jgi:hypothetical protein